MPNRRRTRRSSDDGALLQIDLTAMIDIVFLLLIFFMVSTRFLDPFGYKVELPETEAAPKQVGATQTPVVTVAADGSAWIENKKYETADAVPGIEQWTDAILRADKQATHGVVMRWMDRLRQAGVTAVTLSSTPLEKQTKP